MRCESSPNLEFGPERSILPMLLPNTVWGRARCNQVVGYDGNRQWAKNRRHL